MLNFGNKEVNTSGPLVPNGTLAWVSIHFKEYKHAKESGGGYWNVELTVLEGPYTRRKVFDMLCNPSDLRSGEAWRKMGFNAFKRIMEAAGINMSQLAIDSTLPQAAQESQAAQMMDYVVLQLDGKRIPIQIKIEEGSDGFEDKNKVTQYLSPNPESKSNKKYLELMSGVGQAAAPGAPAGAPPAPTWGAAAKPAPAAAPAPGWGAQSQAAAPAPAPAQGFSQPQPPSQPASIASVATTQAGSAHQSASPSNAAAGPAWLTKAA